MLANERTLLAYVRTALALAGGGAALVHFSPESLVQGIGWALIAAGMLLLPAGLLRFRNVRQRIGQTFSAANAEPSEPVGTRRTAADSGAPPDRI